MAKPILMAVDDDPDARFYMLLEGELAITKRVGDQEVTLATHQPGAFTGGIPLLAGTPYNATARATRASRLLGMDPETFEGMIAHCPEAANTILRTMAKRMQITESVVRGQEKLAALGKLAAGLVHELNNPAAAYRLCRREPRA